MALRRQDHWPRDAELKPFARDMRPAAFRRHLATEPFCMLSWPTDRIFRNTPHKPVSRSWRSWLLRVVFWFTGLILAGALGVSFVVLTALAVAYPNLPNISELQDYRPKLPLRVFSSEGILIGEFGEERREFTPISTIPKLMKDAVLAAEDARFYDHNGVDFKSMVRAGYANLNRAQEPGRLNHHDAGGTQRVPDFGENGNPQGLRGPAHIQAGATPLQGSDLRDLSESGLPGQAGVRLRRGLGGLFRQAAQGHLDRTSRDAGGFAQSARCQ